MSERLREVLRDNKMSQSELARRIEMSVDSVNGYCRGKATPPIEVLIKICRVLQESADYLLGLKD